MSQFREDSGQPPFDLSIKQKIVKFYENRAPEKLVFDPAKEKSLLYPPVRFKPENFVMPEQSLPAVSNVNLVHLTHETKLDVLVCDMREGWITVFKPYAPDESFVVGKLAHPAHAEVVDLDKDGIKDIVVADLGNFLPTNEKKGKVVWFKGLGNNKFADGVTLLDNVGRVADVQMADFSGDGKNDLIVAVFGWRLTGEIIYLQNQTTDWQHPKFVPHLVDGRHGAIHVPVRDMNGAMVDLNGDGKPDFVALISQEHETVVAFLNQGKDNEGKVTFRPVTLFEGPHPSYGSSGIQLVDLNKDGKVDVLYTNGDVLDSGPKPWHSVQWLENQTEDWQEPKFIHHHLTTMPGVHRAVAADVDGDGLLDIIAVSFLPAGLPAKVFPGRDVDSIILLRQAEPGKFVRYALEKNRCNRVSFAAGDLDGDGKIHFVTGDFFMGPATTEAASIPAVTVWRNHGAPKKSPKVQ
jgi:hypothetical protein